MIILGIESSCDETSAAVVKNGSQILSSVVASSEKIQQKYGGIIPEQAAREQIKYIIPVVQETIENCKLKIKNLNAVAVTVGPGLIGSLLVGVETAKTLSFVWQKPIIPINHLAAHLYANFLQPSPPSAGQASILFPALGLIVSGGHTQLVLMTSHQQLTVIGSTKDDAAGECFDKTARLLGLGYPGGPAIEKAAKKINSSTINHQPSTVKLPRPMIKQDNFDFSFSGLKTAVFNQLTKAGQSKNKTKKQSRLLTRVKNHFAKEIQEAITDVLVEKTIRAGQHFPVKSILLGGGVASNQRLREKLKSAVNRFLPAIKLFLPAKEYCTDNAAAIASAAYFSGQKTHWSKIKPNPSLETC